MDAMDILGALLGKKSGGAPSPGGSVFKDLAGSRSSRSSGTRTTPPAARPRSLDGAAQSLEELLNVGGRSAQPAPRHQHSPAAPTPSLPPQASLPPAAKPSREVLDEQSRLLIRAMISATKADGQVSQDEQDRVVEQLGQLNNDDVRFLREEFAKPLDVKSFCWSVPQGLEEQVYTVSLMAIRLDTQEEAEYLGDLAHGLRIAPQRCNEIHRQHNAPEIFR